MLREEADLLSLLPFTGRLKMRLLRETTVAYREPHLAAYRELADGGDRGRYQPELWVDLRSLTRPASSIPFMIGAKAFGIRTISGSIWTIWPSRIGRWANCDKRWSGPERGRELL